MSDDIIEDVAGGMFLISAAVGVLSLFIAVLWALLWAVETQGFAITLAMVIALSTITAGVSMAVLVSRD